MSFCDPSRADVANACATAILAPAVAASIGALAWAVDNGGAAAAPFGLLLAFISLVTALIVAGGHVLLLGLPAYLIVRRFTAPGWRLAGGCGFLLGAAPFLLIAAVGGDGLVEDLPIALFLGAMGLIGGLGFRWKLYS